MFEFQTYFYLKNHCLSEIHIQLGVLYFCLQNLATPSFYGFLSPHLIHLKGAWGDSVLSSIPRDLRMWFLAGQQTAPFIYKCFF